MVSLVDWVWVSKLGDKIYYFVDNVVGGFGCILYGCVGVVVVLLVMGSYGGCWVFCWGFGLIICDEDVFLCV